MLIGLNDRCCIDNDIHIIEPDINDEASRYLLDNYKNLLGIIRSYEISEQKANDLLHDVWLSLFNDEQNGEGFNMEYGSHYDADGNMVDRLISVQQFVIGRIKLYAKNAKYRTDIVEATASMVDETQTYYEEVVDKKGNKVLNPDGTVKMEMKTIRKKVPSLITSSAASFDEGAGTDKEDYDSFQMAYMKASVADSSDDITDELSIREEIDYCIDVCSMHDVNILNILKNIDTLAEMLGSYSRKKKAAESVFSKITELVETHDELGANLMDVLKFASKNKSTFEAVIATY